MRSVLLLTFFFLLTFVFTCALFPITDTDVWWHLSTGRWVWEHRAIPRIDPFCTSSLGQPWLDAQWGFQLLVYALWKLGGNVALVAAKSIAFTSIFALIFMRSWTRKTAPFLLAIGVFAAFHGRHLADLRPVWVTVFLLALQYRLLRDHLDGRIRLLWPALIASQIIMVQMQGLYWIGPVQFAVMLLGNRMEAPRRNRLRIFCGLLFTTSLLNPYGWRGWIFPLKLLARIIPLPENLFSREVAENIPYWRWLVENPAEAYPFLILAAIVVGLLVWTRARNAKGEVGLLMIYGTLGLMAQRNLILFLFAVLIIAARSLPVLITEKNGNGLRFKSAAVFALAWTLLSVAGFASDLRASWQWEKSGTWETPFRFPQGATAWLREHPLQGTLFNEMRQGGYVGWHLWPGYHPFIDGRMILHDAFFMREFLDLFDHPEKFEEYRQRYSITTVLLPIGEDDRYLPLAASLARSGTWSILYCDGADILLALPAAWEGSAKPPAWTLEVGEISARQRFGGNPKLLVHARQRLRIFLPDPALEESAILEPTSSSLLNKVIALENISAREFPGQAPKLSSLQDSLEQYRQRLLASGFSSLSRAHRAEALSLFLFDTLRLQSSENVDSLNFSLPTQVLRNRKGSCVGLSLLLMTLAEKMDIGARPVFLPGHLFVRLASGTGAWRNVELLRKGLARSDSFYLESFQILGRPWYRMLSSEPEQALAALIFNLGNAHRNTGAIAIALGEYRLARQVLPGFPDALGSEGAMLLVLGETMEARKRLEESLAGDPLSHAALENYAKVSN